MSEKDGLLEVDESMPIDQLRQKANEEMSKETPARDDKGRFVAQPQGDGDPGEPTEFIATREIDLGDGSGVQVFEGKGETEKDALEALTDKITEAQKNATIKIRQQEAELRDLRTKTAEKPKPVEITADQEYIWSQEIVKNPSKVVREIIKAASGAEVEVLGKAAKRIDVTEDTERKAQATTTFLLTHEDYEDGNPTEQGVTPERIAAGQRNAKAIQLAMHGKEWNTENLHRAYLNLKKSGLLVLKGEEAHADPTQKPAATERIAQPRAEAADTRTRRGSGISSHGRPAAVPKTELSEDELRQMPLEKLREISNKQLAGQS